MPGKFSVRQTKMQCKIMPGPGNDRAPGLRRERSLPTRASGAEAAGWQGGFRGCCSTFYLQESQPFRATRDPCRATVTGSDQGTPACKQTQVCHMQTSLLLTHTVQTMQFRLPPAKAFLWWWGCSARRLKGKPALQPPSFFMHSHMESPQKKSELEVVRFAGLFINKRSMDVPASQDGKCQYSYDYSSRFRYASSKSGAKGRGELHDAQTIAEVGKREGGWLQKQERGFSRDCLCVIIRKIMLQE